MLKRESRIIGLSAPRKLRLKNPIIGAVFRGSFWLDGLVTHTIDRTDPTYLNGLAAAIRRCKQYSQIHAAIFSRASILPQGLIDFTLLAEKLDISILVISRKQTCASAKSTKLRTRKNSTSIWSPTENPVRANELFSIGCAEHMTIPEAVRVADLIATQL